MIIHPRTGERIAKAVIWTAAVFVIAVLMFIILYLLGKGLPNISWEFLTKVPSDMGRRGGILSPLVGTLLVTSVAVCIAAPLGIGTAFYLAEYTREGVITKVIRFSANSLAGIPSIVYGLFGLIFFVDILGLGWCILSGGLTLAIMTLPTVIRTAEEAIITVPKIYREVSFSLGATKWQTTFRTVFPSALPGIVNGIILAVGRCVAETAAVGLTAGSALRMPGSLSDSTRTMAYHFYMLAREGISMKNAYGTAAILIILILLINVVANTLLNNFIAKKSAR